ncbi:hypothetical protein DFH06DRAFT_1299391 [Mycena polygramma]|nr:hypothetical protein DFH06DRAFT_1299391 [Mycena polygramma]
MPAVGRCLVNLCAGPRPAGGKSEWRSQGNGDLDSRRGSAVRNKCHSLGIGIHALSFQGTAYRQNSVICDYIWGDMYRPTLPPVSEADWVTLSSLSPTLVKTRETKGDALLGMHLTAFVGKKLPGALQNVRDDIGGALQMNLILHEILIRAEICEAGAYTKAAGNALETIVGVSAGSAILTFSPTPAFVEWVADTFTPLIEVAARVYPAPSAEPDRMYALSFFSIVSGSCLTKPAAYCMHHSVKFVQSFGVLFYFAGFHERSERRAPQVHQNAGPNVMDSNGGRVHHRKAALLHFSSPPAFNPRDRLAKITSELWKTGEGRRDGSIQKQEEEKGQFDLGRGAMKGKRKREARKAESGAEVTALLTREQQFTPRLRPIQSQRGAIGSITDCDPLNACEGLYTELRRRHRAATEGAPVDGQAAGFRDRPPQHHRDSPRDTCGSLCLRGRRSGAQLEGGRKSLEGDSDRRRSSRRQSRSRSRSRILGSRISRRSASPARPTLALSSAPKRHPYTATHDRSFEDREAGEFDAAGSPPRYVERRKSDGGRDGSDSPGHTSRRGRPQGERSRSSSTSCQLLRGVISTVSTSMRELERNEICPPPADTQKPGRSKHSWITKTLPTSVS